ncbi:tRNA-binding protein [Cohnella soli]|uniref:tRNA-binding protein n=1 Tax=Cohnella soli TaxID=425005 RepID=A0ABW0I0F5_9BACL
MMKVDYEDAKRFAPINDNTALDIRTGTIVEAEMVEEAMIPMIKLIIDFGPEIGLKTSSSQITKRTNTEDMIGRRVIGIMNDPPRRVAGFKSDALVLGRILEIGDVILLKPAACWGDPEGCSANGQFGWYF